MEGERERERETERERTQVDMEINEKHAEKQITELNAGKFMDAQEF
jgi:hypothetical protein